MVDDSHAPLDEGNFTMQRSHGANPLVELQKSSHFNFTMASKPHASIHHLRVASSMMATRAFVEPQDLGL
jgi:hypothetical protein